MRTLTFVKPKDLVALLNISDSFYDMTYQHKIIFYIRDGFKYAYLYTCYPSHIRVLKSEKMQTHTQTQSKRENPLNWVWYGRITTGIALLSCLSLS